MASGRSFDIAVDGLAQLRKDLIAAHESYEDILVSAGRKAAMVVVEGARSRAAGQGAQASRAAEQALKPVLSGRYAAVRLSNSKAVPFALGAEFGAAHNRPRRNQRKGRPYLMKGWNNLPLTTKGGRFLWPTIKASGQQIMDAYMDELDRLLRKFNL